MYVAMGMSLPLFFLLSISLFKANANIISLQPKNIYVPVLPGYESVLEPANVIVSTHIIGGTTAAKYQFPWQVHLSIDNSYACGGSLISRGWVLTAAHCTHGFKTFTMTFGAPNLNNIEIGKVTLKSTEVVVHPQYNENTIANDLGIIKLPIQITISASITTIRLPKTADVLNKFAGVLATVSGYGLTANGGSTSSTIQFIQLFVITNAQCTSVFGKNYVIDSTICTSGASRTGTCNGDSGGPLVYKEADGNWTQIGVVSFGSVDCSSYDPSAYARLTSFLPWITQITGINRGDGSVTEVTPTTVPPILMNVIKIPKLSSPLTFATNKTLMDTKIKVNTPKIDSRPTGKTVQVNAGVSGGFGSGNSVIRGTFPWLAVIEVVDPKKSKWFCNGALILANWVLTSASCTYKGTSIEVILGAFNRTANEQDRVVRKTVLRKYHTGFIYNSLLSIVSNDLALLKLDTSVTLSKNIGILRLPKQSDASNPFFGTTASLGGWGYFTKNFSTGSILNVTELTVIPTFDCLKSYGSKNILPDSLCAIGNTLKSELCGVDSGAPLIIKEADSNYMVIGVVSFTSGICSSTDPVVFTRVASFIGWISRETGAAIRV